MERLGGEENRKTRKKGGTVGEGEVPTNRAMRSTEVVWWNVKGLVERSRKTKVKRVKPSTKYQNELHEWVYIFANTGTSATEARLPNAVTTVNENDSLEVTPNIVGWRIIARRKIFPSELSFSAFLRCAGNENNVLADDIERNEEYIMPTKSVCVGCLPNISGQAVRYLLFYNIFGAA